MDGFIFVGTTTCTNFYGFSKIKTFVEFNIHVHSILLHNVNIKSLFRGYLISWIVPSMKTMKIGTPRKLSHPQYPIVGCWLESRVTVGESCKTDIHRTNRPLTFFLVSVSKVRPKADLIKEIYKIMLSYWSMQHWCDVKLKINVFKPVF